MTVGARSMHWIHPDAESVTAGARGGSKAANRRLFHARLQAGPPPGLIGHDGGGPVAWARVTPRAALPGLKNARFFTVSGADAAILSISCFVMKPRRRDPGRTGALIAAAVPFARARGAEMLEAYANDPDAPITPAAATLGIASTFVRAGFVEAGWPWPGKVLMRRKL